MSFRSSQWLDTDFDDIICDTVNVTKNATINNLTVTGTCTLPSTSDDTSTMQTLTVTESLVSQGTTTLDGAVTMNNNLTCIGNVILGDQTTSEGSVIVTNPYLYCAYNSNGVAPSVDADTYPQLYGCITGNMEAGKAEVDFVNLSTDSPHNEATIPAFNFYKMPSTTPIAQILNNGQFNCSAIDCTGSATIADETITNSTITNLTNTNGSISNLTTSSSILSNNANIGTSYSYLGFYQGVLLQGSLSPASSGDLSTYTNIFSYSALPPGVYMCLCTLVLVFSAGTSLSGYYVQGVLNGNLSTFPFGFYDNYATSFTNTTQINVPCNFLFTNTESNGTLGIQISCSYGGTFQVLGETTYSQVIRIA
jgi:hypothetical protein